MDYERKNCLGERYLGCAMGNKILELDGVPGNDLGAYLDGGEIIVHGNAQDATGDTMNYGTITIHGHSGDALGYSMRGGEIYVKDYCGYRAGIHMKASLTQSPTLVIGSYSGSFLGEYQAGGTIIVMGIGCEGSPIVGDFCGTGMHGGRIFLRTDCLPADLPAQIISRDADEEDKASIRPYVERYCASFGGNPDELLSAHFYVLLPNSKSPYRQLYTNF